MKTADALKRIFDASHPDDLIVLGDGRISTESLYLADSKNHFYMLGSMGQASMIGLGICLGKPDRRCIVVEGDGNLLMNPAAVIVIGSYMPSNLIHVVIDNGVYGTTGGQQNLNWDMIGFARSNGYKHVFDLDLSNERENLDELMALDGPVFIRINILDGGLAGVPTFNKQPMKIVEDFRSQI